jgi:hypothetical protein
MNSVLSGAHLSTLVLTAYEYPVTREVFNFYFHPAISEPIPVLYTVLRQLAKSYCYVWGLYTILLQSQHITEAVCMKSAVYATIPQDSCLTLATKYSFFHSMKCAPSQCTMNKTQAQTTSCSNISQSTGILNL